MAGRSLLSAFARTPRRGPTSPLRSVRLTQLQTRTPREQDFPKASCPASPSPRGHCARHVGHETTPAHAAQAH